MRHSEGMSKRTAFHGYKFALVICRHPHTGKFLAVNESNDKGWWIPGGGVAAGETFRAAAIRETNVEAGIDIVLKGIIKIENCLCQQDLFKMRVIFYAEPKDPAQTPKSVPDSYSNGAAWVSLEEFRSFQNIRGRELLVFGKQVDKGRLFPLHVFEED